MNEQTNKNYTPYTFQMKRRTNKTSKVIDLKKTQSRAANNRNFIYHLHTFRSIQSMIILHFASFAFAFFSIFTHKGEEKKIQSNVFFPFQVSSIGYGRNTVDGVENMLPKHLWFRTKKKSNSMNCENIQLFVHSKMHSLFMFLTIMFRYWKLSRISSQSLLFVWYFLNHKKKII